MARVRTEAKRREIIEVAARLFEGQGYDRTSMSQISEALGGSKATLYGYFKSKEELLLAVLDYDVTHQADELMDQFLSAPNLRDGLVLLGRAYMTRRLAPRPISNVRIVSSQPEESDIGRIFYQTVLQPAWERLSSRFQAMMDAGMLKQADPWVAAMQFKGLNEWDLFDKRLLGAVQQPDPAEIERAAITAADAFLTLYGTDVEAKRANPRAAKADKPKKKAAA